MRADQADYRPDTAVIQSRTVTVTDMGGQSAVECGDGAMLRRRCC